MFRFEKIEVAKNVQIGPLRNEPNGPQIITCLKGMVTVRSSLIENTRFIVERQYYMVNPTEEVTIEGHDDHSVVQLYIKKESE